MQPELDVGSGPMNGSWTMSNHLEMALSISTPASRRRRQTSALPAGRLLSRGPWALTAWCPNECLGLNRLNFRFDPNSFACWGLSDGQPPGRESLVTKSGLRASSRFLISFEASESFTCWKIVRFVCLTFGSSKLHTKHQGLIIRPEDADKLKCFSFGPQLPVILVI